MEKESSRFTDRFTASAALDRLLLGKFVGYVIDGLHDGMRQLFSVQIQFAGTDQAVASVHYHCSAH